jgi:hypothetical protein
MRAGPRVVAAAVVAVTAACGASTTIRRPLSADARGGSYAIGTVSAESADVPRLFVSELSSAVWARLNNAHRAVPRGAADAYRVDVTVTAFRRRSTATRVLFGAMAGADAAEALVRVVSPGGDTAGEWTVRAYNASTGTDEAWVANALADEIVRTLVHL